jgi:predicted RNA-binding Zn-ribbon protein involved in translation (DUF1610 family)
MGANSVAANCFLCGAEAICTDTDAGNRKFFQCTNPECGDYEISRTAMRRMEDAPTHKQQAMRQAHMYRGTDKFVEIIVGPDSQVVVQPVPRAQSS